MAAIALVFRVCRAVAATNMETSTILASTAIGGVPRPTIAGPGTAYSIPATAELFAPTDFLATGLVFVAFGIERAG